jgi:AcrR family transcriptional regulator
VARSKDENKRSMILQSAKALFAQKGFYNTSISDIVEETELPVGTIYTYFKNKEEIVRVIVEEGWQNLLGRLENEFSGVSTNREKVKILINRFLPELLTDLDLINILITEAIDYTKIEEKIETLTQKIFTTIRPLARSNEIFQHFDRKTMYAALMVYFLGIMNAAKIAKDSSIGVETEDILRFVEMTIENVMDIQF